ncbi:MAG TPA: DJ-1/PfpI family protein [Bryobacteraceae bacterium]|jgi:protease I
MSDKILIVTGDAGESYEALYAVHRLEESGYTAVVAAPSKRRLHLVIHDFEPGWDTYVERQPGYGLEANTTFEKVKVKDYAAILLLGGRAPEYLRNDAKLLKIVRGFDESEKWIFSICHGIQILVAAGITKGKRVTCYEHVKYEVESTGGTWIGKQAVRDGRIVTGQTWQSHPDFYRLVMECLSGPPTS